MKNIILSIKDLVVKFRVRSKVLTSIRNISFDIYDGETVAIVGESGSGKSVLTKTLTNMLESNGYIANGSIMYYPSKATKENESAVFKKDLDLVEFHKNSLESESRKGIKKYNNKKIKDALLTIKELKESTIESLNLKIDELQQKADLLKKYEFTNSTKKLVKRNEYLEQIKQLKEQIEWKKDPKKLEFEIQQLEKIIQTAKKEIYNFKTISAFKKFKYFQIVSLINKFNKNELEDINKLEPHIKWLDEIEYKNNFESLALEIFYDIRSNQTKKLDQTKVEALNEMWNFVKRFNFWIKRSTDKNLQHLRGGTIATIFQDPMTSLNPLLSVGYQISEVLRNHSKLNRAEAKVEAINLMKRVGIPNAEKRYKDLPGKYSGGMRQRVVIAIALACRPKVLICDEPTTALDVTIQAQILDLIKELKEEYKFTVIFITHDLGVVANIADRVAVMYAGQIIEYGTTQDVFFNSKHPYTWALLSSLPQLGTKGEELYSISGTPPSLFKEIKADAFAPRNTFALAVDYKYEPPMFKISDTHYAKTWLLDPRAPKIKRPKQLNNLKKAVSESKVGE
ncbi:oligopeptide ABC transporter ATP-binding protein OppD [Mycoplasma capricolum]|uniref:oligopeptide ABC transporter ATP-binding protein OppD n=1 Tax=Mycoplasma capricolum TaxID=2095 RepID=UPI003DA685F9